MMDKEFVNKMKDILLEKRKALEERLSNFAKKNKKAEGDYESEFPQFGDEEGENADEVAAYDSNLSLEYNLEKMLQDVNKALERIEKGEYGLCKYCGKEIGEKRLMARPVSGACVDCKERLTGKK